MNQKTAYKISIFFGIAGLTLIYASSLYTNIGTVDIGKIDSSWSGRNVKISGTVNSSTLSGNNLFLDVEDETGKILVVKFDTSKSFEEGEKVNVTGHVSIYKGQLEIIAKKIEAGNG